MLNEGPSVALDKLKLLWRERIDVAREMRILKLLSEKKECAFILHLGKQQLK